MRLWMRVYILALPLALAALIACGARLLWMSHDGMMQREVQRALGDHRMVEAALSTHLGAVDNTFQHDNALRERALATAAQNYGKYYTGDDVAIAIMSGDGRTLFSGLDSAESDILDLSPPLGGARQYVVRRLDDGRMILFVSGWCSEVALRFRIDFMRDISLVARDARAYAWQMCAWLLGASLVLGILLYLLINAAMRPLAALTRRVGLLTRGDYSARIAPGVGEVGALAKAFNDMADAVEQRVEQLKRAAQDRDTFMANLAHEMKTPMTTILGYAQLLRRASLTQAQRTQALDAILCEGTRLDALSHKLLSLFGLQGGGEQATEKGEVAIAPLFERLRMALALQLQQSGVTLCLVTELEHWDLDVALFQLLLINLVDNAIKASRAGDVIELGAKMAEGRALFWVRDQGCGIPEEELARVCQPFYMVDKARARRQNGAGLGLTLCEAIAKVHGATLTIEGALDHGTEVRIVF